MSDTPTTPAVWFVTGAARGMGIELAQAALDAGYCVVGTARKDANVTAALGEHDKAMNGQQVGDPAKLGRALVQSMALDDAPLRWIAGTDAVAAVEQKAHELLAQADAHRDLSSNLAHDDV